MNSPNLKTKIEKTRLFYSQFGRAVSVDALEKQWVDLGDLSQFSCIVKPSICGATGGSLSVWIKLGVWIKQGGILSSMDDQKYEGIDIFRINADKMG